MNTYERATSEYSQILNTKFWDLFVARLREYRGVLSRQCETEDDPRRSQGGVIAIDFILGRNEQQPLAERLLAELKKKSD